MTILQRPLQSGDGHAAKGWHRFGHRGQAVRYTEAWEHETFAEEQARWERSDPEYALICEQVRRADERGGEASRRAHEVKAEWDARVATERHANDDVQRAHQALKAEQRAGHQPVPSRTSSERRTGRSHTTFAIESNDSPAPGIMPEPVRVHDEPVVATAPRGERRGARLRFRGRATRSPVRSEPTRLEVW